jgi:hypothetical protein
MSPELTTNLGKRAPAASHKLRAMSREHARLQEQVSLLIALG